MDIENDKSGAGAITIEDIFSSSSPIAFGTAIMTYAKYEIIDSNATLLTTENQKVKVGIISKGASVKIVDEQVPIPHLRSGKTALRIGIEFIKPISKGSICIKYAPVLG